MPVTIAVKLIGEMLFLTPKKAHGEKVSKLKSWIAKEITF